MWVSVDRLNNKQVTLKRFVNSEKIFLIIYTFSDLNEDKICYESEIHSKIKVIIAQSIKTLLVLNFCNFSVVAFQYDNSANENMITAATTASSLSLPLPLLTHQPQQGLVICSSHYVLLLSLVYKYIFVIFL